MGTDGTGVRVMVVDDHPLWRQTLVKVLTASAGIEVIAEAPDGEEAVRLAHKVWPDVTVMDMEMPRLSGLDATARIVAFQPDARILVLSAAEGRDEVVGAVRAGASGYVLKTAQADEIRAAVARVHAGEMVFPPRLASIVLAELRRPTADDAGPPTVTLLFTDIEGSTALSEQAGDRWPRTLAEHRDVLRSVLEPAGGRELSAKGDQCVWSFPRADRAVIAAVAAQRTMGQHTFAHVDGVRVRIGLHTGEPELIEDGYEGRDLSRAARLCDAGHGGQIVVSRITRQLVGNRLPWTLGFRDLGQHRLRGFNEPEHVFDVLVEGEPPAPTELRDAHAERVGRIASHG